MNIIMLLLSLHFHNSSNQFIEKSFLVTRKKDNLKIFLFTFFLFVVDLGTGHCIIFQREVGWNVGHRETVYFKFGAYLKSSL